MDRLKNSDHALPPPDGVPPAPQVSFKSLPDAYFLGYVPRPLALLCVGENPLVVAWHMPVNKNPFLYAVAIDRDNYSHSLLEKGKDFTLNFVSVDYLEDLLLSGRHHGNRVNKWELFKEITPVKAVAVDALMVEQALLVYECRQEKLISFTDHSLLIGKVELLHYRRGKLKPHKVKYPLHMGKGYFCRNSGVYTYRE